MARRVLIVDDHPWFRAVAREVLESEGMDVVGEASDGESAMAASAALDPTVVLLDVNLPGVDGFAVAERLAAMAHPPQVVLISSRPRSTFATRLTRSPAAGFLDKCDLSAAAITAIVG